MHGFNANGDQSSGVLLFAPLLRQTYKLCFVCGRGLGDGLEVLHGDPLHVFHGGARVQHHVLHEDADGPQHEGHKQVHVDVVAGAVQAPAGRTWR